MGRPKSYERDEVVDRALEVFREEGFLGASVDSLVRGTGLNRHSLYEVFGDKRGLFIEVLDRFQSRKLAEASQLLRQPGPKIPLFRRYFEIIRDNGQRNGPINCLVTTSAVNQANADQEIANRLRDHFVLLEAIFVEVLEVARAQGEICPQLDLLPLARTLINAGRGMRVIAQFEGFNETVEDIISSTLTLLRPNPSISERSF